VCPADLRSQTYFLKKDGKFLNSKLDKSVWVKWMELRVHGEVDVIQAPTGMLPEYEDLRKLFKQVLSRDYTLPEYIEQFTIRVPENIGQAWPDREDLPQRCQRYPAVVLEVLAAQRARLIELQKAKGDYVSPLDL